MFFTTFVQAGCYAIACPGTFGALAVRGLGVPDRGEMEEKEKEKEEWADLMLKSSNPTLNSEKNAIQSVITDAKSLVYKNHEMIPRSLWSFR